MTAPSATVRTLHLLRIAVLAICCALPLGAAAQSNVQPSGTIAIQESAEEDAAIAGRIRKILSELDGFGDVTVSVSSGIVTFRGTTLDRATALRLNELAGRVAGVVAIENQVIETTDVVERLNPVMDRFWTRLKQIVAFLPLLGVALALFALIVFAGVYLARLRAPWDRIAPNPFIADIYRQIVRLAFVVGGVVVALDIVGATALLSTILGAAGIVGLAIGFAVRETVENFIASVMLSIRQPFRPNDTIEIAGDIGKVIRLTSRATTLLSFDGNHIRIPNATVFKSRIVNYTRNAEIRFVFDLGLAPDADLAQARTLAIDTLRALPFVLDNPEALAWIESVGDSTVTLRMVGWIDQQKTSMPLARGEAIRQTLLAFASAGIALPEPTYRIVSAALPQPERPPEPRVPVPPETTEVQAVEATADKHLEAIINLERAETGADDLLSQTAPKE